jgi:uncharacterized membrane protein
LRYVLVSTVILLVTYGQLIIKHRVNLLGSAPALGQPAELGRYLFSALTDLGIVSGLSAAVLAALAWMVTLSRYELSSVYPLLAINFLLVPFFSILFFEEDLNVLKGFGLVIVVAGLVIFSLGVHQSPG